MGEEKLYKLRDFIKLVGISRSGVIKWIKQEKILQLKASPLRAGMMREKSLNYGCILEILASSLF